jgi:hypothetical protein
MPLRFHFNYTFLKMRATGASGSRATEAGHSYNDRIELIPIQSPARMRGEHQNYFYPDFGVCLSHLPGA